MGIGLYDPDSPIRIKMIYFGGSAEIDDQFFKTRIEQAYQFRKEILRSDTNSFRLIFGENDGFPGLIADIYNKVLVIKLYSGIWQAWLTTILDHIVELTKVQAAVMRLSRKMVKAGIPGWADGKLIYGQIDSEIVQFREHGVNFSANLYRGHKTGFFLDHRHNRLKVGRLSSGKRVLDVFAYSGGFSVHALVGGATEVTSIDISAQALEQARTNAALNLFDGIHNTICGDAFEILSEFIAKKESYDLVIIDPPSFAKKKDEVELALKKYRQLARFGIELTANDGILVLASCSSRVTDEQFMLAVRTEFNNSGKTIKIIEHTTHDTDHPVSFSEGEYLKCVYAKIST